MPGVSRPKLILAQDIDYPPYAFLGGPDQDFDVAGIGHDIAHGLKEVCDIDVVTVQTDWSKCWEGRRIGRDLAAGEMHGCMTFTHLIGSRNRFLEFSDPILDMNKPAGILSRLVDGIPVINGLSDLSGKKVAEVTGWAPTADTLAMSTNKCNMKPFIGFEMISPPVPDGANANDVALSMLLDGDVDAVWIYADQAHLYQCKDGVTADWNCSMWAGFGTTFAYVQTGITSYAYNGTTLTMSKKGSGLPDIVNPCIQEFLKTRSYYEICQKHDLVGSCFPNDYFPDSPPYSKAWSMFTRDLTTSCKDGYCPCPASN
jgi:hypothetical protein